MQEARQAILNLYELTPCEAYYFASRLATTKQFVIKHCSLSLEVTPATFEHDLPCVTGVCLCQSESNSATNTSFCA